MYTCPMHPDVCQAGPGTCPKCGMTIEPVMPSTPEPSKTEWTCPMHPDVCQAGPGACLKCGMTLEPVMPSTPESSKTEWTCPMHPEIVRDGPGSCPKCGMALEPRTVSLAEKESNPEYEVMHKRFIVGAILTLPLVIIAMRDLIPGGRLLDTLAPANTYEWLALILATPVILWGGWPFFVR